MLELGRVGGTVGSECFLKDYRFKFSCMPNPNPWIIKMLDILANVGQEKKIIIIGSLLSCHP